MGQILPRRVEIFLWGNPCCQGTFNTLQRGWHLPGREKLSQRGISLKNVVSLTKDRKRQMSGDRIERQFGKSMQKCMQRQCKFKDKSFIVPFISSIFLHASISFYLKGWSHFPLHWILFIKSFCSTEMSIKVIFEMQWKAGACIHRHLISVVEKSRHTLSWPLAILIDYPSYSGHHNSSTSQLWY